MTRRKISLVLADVDGTLVDEHKVLTPRAQAAVHRLGEAGIRFAVTSGRPPRGMAMLQEPLRIDTPIAGFNGGLFINPDLTILDQKTLPAEIAAESIELLRRHGLDVWVYRGNEWLVDRPDAPHVAHEAWTVKFEPRVVADVAANLDGLAKVVGVSDDFDRVQRCEGTAKETFGERATANRSQPYYLDVTNRNANKGAVAEFLSRHFAIPLDEIATIGDQPTDVPMFKRSGLSIAMGNASDQVKAQAMVATASYNDEGFAKAMERFILDASH